MSFWSTLVETEDGLKPIEEIEVGDLVLAYDEETGEQAYKKVVRLFRNETKEWYHIFVNGEEIVCTGGHPFYILNAEDDRRHVLYGSARIDKGGKWICAQDLKIGDQILTSNGTCAIIEKIQVEQLDKPETTYNFEVEDFHTYYVTESNVLVHNDCRGKNKLKPDSKAEGAHTTFARDPATGKITHYATYEPNPLNPSGFDEVLRFDGVGASHISKVTKLDIPTPHIHSKSISGGIGVPEPWQLPRGY